MLNGNLLTTGNAAVDAVGMMDISGNVIPNAWYSHILRDNGKPHHFAISLLAEIVYWYKPVEIRDEESGRTIGYRRKFKGDLLQKSYEQLGSKFGEERQTVKRALDCLERLGVIRREYRTITVGRDGTRLNNVMFIALIPDGLKRITYTGEDATDDTSDITLSDETDVDNSAPLIKSDTTLPSNLTGGSVQICGEAPVRSDRTYTENTPKTTYGDYSHPIYLSWGPVPRGEDKPVKTMDRMDDINAYRDLVRENIEYEALLRDCRYDTDRERMEEIYELLCEVVCMTSGTVRIGGQDMPHQIVQSVFMKLRRHHIEYAIECMEKTITKVGNMRAYLLTTLYRSAQTFQNSLDQQVRHDMYEYAISKNDREKEAC